MSAFDPWRTSPNTDPNHFQTAGLTRYDAAPEPRGRLCEGAPEQVRLNRDAASSQRLSAPVEAKQLGLEARLRHIRNQRSRGLNASCSLFVRQGRQLPSLVYIVG